MNLRTVKWAQWDKTQSRELLGLFICVCSVLCTIVAHNIAQNRPDNLPSYPPDNHHCSDDVYLREGGNSPRYLRCLLGCIAVLHVAYCYRLSTVICCAVCLSQSWAIFSWKNGWIDRDTISTVGSGCCRRRLHRVNGDIRPSNSQGTGTRVQFRPSTFSPCIL